MVLHGARRRNCPDLVFSGALAWSDGSVVAKVPLDVCHDNMTVDALSHHKPLAGDITGRHGARWAQRKQVSKTFETGLKVGVLAVESGGEV